MGKRKRRETKTKFFSTSKRRHSRDHKLSMCVFSSLLKTFQTDKRQTYQKTNGEQDLSARDAIWSVVICNNRCRYTIVLCAPPLPKSTETIFRDIWKTCIDEDQWIFRWTLMIPCVKLSNKSSHFSSSSVSTLSCVRIGLRMQFVRHLFEEMHQTAWRKRNVTIIYDLLDVILNDGLVLEHCIINSLSMMFTAPQLIHPIWWMILVGLAFSSASRQCCLFALINVDLVLLLKCHTKS